MNQNLKELIEFIQNKHSEISDKWKENENYKKINLSKKEVRNINEHSEILEMIFCYRDFLNENNVQLTMNFERFNKNNDKVNTRIKQKNSAEEKLKNYKTSEKHNFRKRAYK